MHSRGPRTVRRFVLTAVAVSLSATALLAIGILLFGNFGETESRILQTTLMLAAYGLVSLPAGFLLDQARQRALAAAILGLAATGLVPSLFSVWSGGSSAAVGKIVLTATVFALAASQIGALAARAGESDPTPVRVLFAASCATALVLATMATVAAWAELGSSAYFRAFGALAVLDALLVLLQPVLALARPRGEVYHLRLELEQGEQLDTEVEAGDFATAAARAIREAEGTGRRVPRGRPELGPGGQKARFPADLLEGRQCAVEVLRLERGGHLDADARRSLRDDRIAEAGHEDALLEQPAADLDREGRVPDDDRDDRRLAGERLEACLRKLPAERFRARMELLHELRLRTKRSHRGERPQATGGGIAFEKSCGRGALGQEIARPRGWRRRSRRRRRRAPCRACS